MSLDFCPPLVYNEFINFFKEISMKKLLLLTAIITLVAVLAACTGFGSNDTSSDVVSADTGVSSNGITVDETGSAADTNATVGDTVSGNVVDMGGTPSNPTTNTPSNTTSSNGVSETSSTYTPSSSSTTSSESGNNGRPGGDNEGGWDETWNGNASSSTPTVETPVIPPTQDDETETPPTASTGSDWEDVDGPGWLGSENGETKWY